MAYSTAVQVAALLQQNTYDNTGITQPTLDQVNDIIDQTDAEIDSTLNGQGVSLPLTDATALKLIEKYSSFGAACTTGMTYFGKNDSVNDTQPTWFCEEFEKFLERVKEDPQGTLGIDISSLDVSNQVLDGTQTESEYNDTQVEDSYEW